MTPDSSASGTKTPGQPVLLLLGIMLLGAALRFFNIGHADLWIDEIYTLMVANTHLPPLDVPLAPVSAGQIESTYLSWQPITWAGLLEMLKVNVHMPLYYLLINPWLGWFGQDETALRSFSALFSILIILPVYALGATLGNRRIGLLAALITALAPFQLYFAQEGRMYSLSLFFAAASSLALWKMLYGNHPGRWTLLYTLTMAGGILTHYIFAFFLAFHGVFALIALLQGPKKRYVWLVVPLVIAGLIALGWAPIYQIQKAGFETESHFAAGLLKWNRYLTVLVWQPLVVVSGGNHLVRALYMPLTGLLLLTWLGFIGLHRKTFRWSNEGFILGWIFVPLLAQIGYDVLSQNHTATIERYTMLIAPGVYLAMAVGLYHLSRARLARRWLLPALASGMILISLANVSAPSPFRDQYNRRDIEATLSTMVDQAAENDLLLVNGPIGAALIAAYYIAPLRPEQPLLWWSQTHAGRQFDLPAEALLSSYDAVWVFSYRSTRERGHKTLSTYLNDLYEPRVNAPSGWNVFQPGEKPTGDSSGFTRP